MALFGGKKTVSTSTSETNVNERTFVTGANSAGIILADSPGARIEQTDLGAVTAAFGFADSALATTRAATSQAIGAAERASRGELKASLDSILKYGLWGVAIYFGASILGNGK